jgi:hypothetical protein
MKKPTGANNEQIPGIFVRLRGRGRMPTIYVFIRISSKGRLSVPTAPRELTQLRKSPRAKQKLNVFSCGASAETLGWVALKPAARGSMPSWMSLAGNTPIWLWWVSGAAVTVMGFAATRQFAECREPEFAAMLDRDSYESKRSSGSWHRS